MGPLKLGQEEMVSSGEDMGKVLNGYFLSVLTFLLRKTKPVPVCEQIFRGTESKKLIDVEVTRELVVRKIDKMKKFKSPGPDEVYPRVIRECKEVVSEPLVNIFRKLVDLGEIPSMWSQANVVPIFKKGHRALIFNFRPVSLTSIVSKLLLQIKFENIWKSPI